MGEAKHLVLDVKTTMYKLKNILCEIKLFDQIQSPNNVEEYIFNNKYLKDEVTIDMIPLHDNSIIYIRLASSHLPKYSHDAEEKAFTYSSLSEVPDLFSCQKYHDP